MCEMIPDWRKHLYKDWDKDNEWKIADPEEIRKFWIEMEEEAMKPSGDKTDSSSRPDHYKLEPEPVKVIQAWNLNFCLGNVIKYVARAGKKPGESKEKDLKKAMAYLEMEMKDNK